MGVITIGPVVRLERPQLLDFLMTRRERRLFVICGRAGQGKTVLAEDFLARGGLRGVWHRCRPEEADPRLLLQSLENELAAACGETGGETGEMTPEARCGRLRELLGRWNRPLYLVLDDFHRLDGSAEAGPLLSRLLTESPGNFHLLLLTRTPPALPLARLRCGGELAEIHDGDLAWNEAEIRTYLQDAAGLKLPDERLRLLVELSQGWPVALVYLAEALAARTEAEQEESLSAFITERTVPGLEDYFDQEIFAALSRRETGALVRLSALTGASAGLARRVLGPEELEVLAGLPKRIHFVKALDESLRIFTLHPLFAACLAARFRRLPASEQAEVHRQAAAYFLQIGHRGEALHHLLAAGDRERALELFAESADELLEHHEIDGLRELLEMFPPELRSGHPLFLYYSAIVTNLQQPADSRRTLRGLLERFRTEGDRRREAKIYSVLLTNQIFYQGNREAVAELIALASAFLTEAGAGLAEDRREVLEALIALGRWWTAPDLDEAYTIALHAEEISYKTQNQEVLIFSRLALSRIYLDRGDFQQARQALEQTERILQRHPDCGQYEALLRFYLGDAFFYLGELKQALHQVARGLETTTPGFMFRKYLLLNQVLYLLYLPDTARAETILSGLQEEAARGSFYVRYYGLYLSHMLLAYRQGNRERAEYYCRRLLDPENRELLRADYPYSSLALAEVLLFLRRNDEALALLNRLLAEAPEEKFPYPAATAHALAGYIHTLGGDGKAAGAHFARLRELLQARRFRNLDICAAELLKSVAAASRLAECEGFSRLAAPELPQAEQGLVIQTLGEFRITRDGREVPAALLARQKKVMDLLKLLIVHRERGMVKELLYDLYWPGYLQKSARDNLNTIIYRLRRILGEEEGYILTGSGDIRLNMDKCSLDADRFLKMIRLGEQAGQAGDALLARDYFYRAKSLYGGDFLAQDLYYDDIRDAREELRGRYLQLLFTLCRMSFDAGEPFQALVLAKELIYRDPLCEPGYRLLMIACALIGNRSEIPRLFEKLNQRLRRYYDIDADPRTAALKESLLAGNPPDAGLWRQEALI
jgi:ATP/maltotriose-dependent transcriptional regulator MalT/DNA-binding SARP family transcriptional activator